MFWKSLAVVAGFLASPSVGTAVNVALESSFGKPPYLLELLETAAQENSSAYFPLLDRIADGQFADLSTEKALYDQFLKILEDEGHLQREALSTFQLALSLHSAAPRIEAHYQYYNTTIGPILTKAQDASCPVWVHYDGKQYCSPELERAQQGFDGPNNLDLPFDRSIRIPGDDGLIATLYVDIENPLLGHFHQTLAEAARRNQNSYRIRYRPPIQQNRPPLRVSGYGVELQLKRTDYIVIDDREDAKSEDGSKQKPLSGKDLEDTSDLKPLSSSELADLGLKTSAHILNNEDPLEALLRISQDFPKYSYSLAQMKYSENFVNELEANRETFLPEGLNALWMNGLQIAWRQMDAFALLDRLRQERAFVQDLQAAGLSASEAISLISNEAITDSRMADDVVRYDWRDDAEGGKVIVWLNNIEKDKRYAEWTSQSKSLLKRMFPGQMPSVRRDIHNMIVPLDFSAIEGVETVIDVLLTLVNRQVPVRFGFVPMGTSPAALSQARIIHYLRETYGISTVISYLKELIKSKMTESAFEKTFTAVIKDKSTRKDREALSYSEVVKGGSLQPILKETSAYLSRLGAVGTDPPAFINGVPVAQNDNWLQVMSNRVAIDLQNLQKRIYEDGIADDVWLAGEFLTNAVTQRNSLVIPEDEDDISLVKLGAIFYDYTEMLDKCVCLWAEDSTNSSQWSQLLVVTDSNSESGQQLIDTAKSFKQNGGQSALELRIIDNPEATGEYAPLVSALGLKAGESGLIMNGRRVGPFGNDVQFSLQDLELLQRYERDNRLGPVVEALEKLKLLERITSPKSLASVSALVAISAVPEVPQGIYDNSGAVRMDTFNEMKEDFTAFSIGDNKTATVQIVGSIDPTSELAQRWVPIIKTLSELKGVYLKLFLNPRGSLKELPTKRFYRYVLSSKPEFSENGSLVSMGASFDGIPRDALLNLGLDVPPAWLVSPKKSVYDLDNLKLSAVPAGDVNAVYELESILVEGHTKDKTTGSAPRGAQLILGTGEDPYASDTLIMANLGYFQFKANPGYWNIQLKPGRSSDIFQIDSIGDGNDDLEVPDTHVALMSWQGKTLFPRFSRKPGKQDEDVLVEASIKSTGDFLAKAKSFGQGILSKAGALSQRKHADINIFSVASGHLYERMLNIMMVSVMKNTKHRVKFWFIEQFLSPSFKSTISSLAQEYDFEYELVTYKWPHWLRSQKEKQREIWGYKILFLDVLFPLDLDKVIFVDSDQVVRTDMYDLINHDLQGAPYGFTPMCDSRTEMEGFRFWKQGYWKNFLQGLPYHISALYVVDLKRFRAMAAGDRLRGQYHQLSADPNSLSNLDQDLPNNMQMQLPIHSLPQEWLWCETWCSDESLKDARTIDLCNNPLTKEPKLDRARRQIPEWNEYDQEIAGVFRRAGSGNDDNSLTTAEGVNIQEEMDRQAKREHDEQKSKEKDEL